MNAILLLVDLQNDYLQDTHTQPHPNALIHAATSVLSKCRDLNIAVAHIRTTISRSDDRRMAHWKQENLWRCVEKTEGHGAPSVLAELEDEIVIHKTGFNPFEDGQLQDILDSGAYDTAIICGIHLHACVREVISGVYSAGLKVLVIDEAVGSNDPVHAAICRRYFEERTVRFIQLKELDNLAGLSETGCSRDLEIDEVQEAFEKWRKVDPDLRIAKIRKIAHQLKSNQEVLAEAITTETGKPIYFATSEIEKTVEMIDDIIKVFQSIVHTSQYNQYMIRHVPKGVIAIITPWNNPLYIALGKIIPAILYGNTVIWKPSPKAKSISDKVWEIIQECMDFNGVVKLIHGGRKEAIDIVNNPMVKGATFTGSLKAGYAIQELCARRHIPVQAELGGNNAAIVWQDADIPDAARQICSGAFEMAGQRCTANRRVIVHQDCAETFLKELKVAMSQLKDHDPINKNARVGPVIDLDEKSRIIELIDRAKSQGFEVYQPGTHQARFVAPALIICDDPTAEIFQEETFGPVLVMHVVNDWEEAISSCNQVKQGLVAAIFTKNSDIEKRFLCEAEAGILKINKTTSDAAIGAPFGGWKASGIGPAEHGKSDLDFYTRLQTVYTSAE